MTIICVGAGSIIVFLLFSARKQTNVFPKSIMMTFEQNNTKTRRMRVCLRFHQWVNSNQKMSEFSTTIIIRIRKPIFEKYVVVFLGRGPSDYVVVHSRLKTAELIKSCFKRFMPFPRLMRHININYTDRLSFLNTPTG